MDGISAELWDLSKTAENSRDPTFVGTWIVSPAVITYAVNQTNLGNAAGTLLRDRSTEPATFSLVLHACTRRIFPGYPQKDHTEDFNEN